MRRIAMVLATGLLLTGCVNAPRIEVSWYPRIPTQIQPCKTLISELPGGVLDQGQRQLTHPEYETDELWETAAVWGDPPIVLKCGVDATQGSWGFQGQAEDPIEVDGITWKVWNLEKSTVDNPSTGSGYRFASTGLTLDVYVTVPHNYAPETGVLAELAPTLEKYKK